MNQFFKLKLSFDEDFEYLYSNCYVKTDLERDSDLIDVLYDMVANDIGPNLYFDIENITYDYLPKGFDQNGGSIMFVEDRKVTLYFSPELSNKGDHPVYYMTDHLIVKAKSSISIEDLISIVEPAIGSPLEKLTQINSYDVGFINNLSPEIIDDSIEVYFLSNIIYDTFQKVDSSLIKSLLNEYLIEDFNSEHGLDNVLHNTEDQDSPEYVTFVDEFIEDGGLEWDLKAEILCNDFMRFILNTKGQNLEFESWLNLDLENLKTLDEDFSVYIDPYIDSVKLAIDKNLNRPTSGQIISALKLTREVLENSAQIISYYYSGDKDTRRSAIEDVLTEKEGSYDESKRDQLIQKWDDEIWSRFEEMVDFGESKLSDYKKVFELLDKFIDFYEKPDVSPNTFFYEGFEKKS